MPVNPQYRPQDAQFFRTTDLDGVPGLPRELVGYGEHLPRVRWQNDAKVAVNIVVNYEEGSEKTFAMGDETNDGMYELPFAVEGQRDLAVESMYEYGARAGIWRMFRVFDTAGIPVTIFGAAVAIERNPAVGAKIAKRGDGDDAGRMMSVGLHPRITGNPARSDGLARFIEYAQGFKDVVFMRRLDIAKMFMKQVPAL